MISSGEKIAIELVASICEQANSRGDYAKLSEIRDAILKSSFSSKKELVAARIVIDEILHENSEQKSKAFIEQTEKKSELAETKRLLAEKEKALLQAEKEREAAEAKRLLAEKEKALLQVNRKREIAETKRLLAEKEKTLLQAYSDYSAEPAKKSLTRNESQKGSDQPKKIDTVLHPNQASIETLSSPEYTELSQNNEYQQQKQYTEENPPNDLAAISINYKEWNRENRINIIKQIYNAIIEQPHIVDLGINQLLEHVSGNTEGLLYKFRQNGLNNLRDISSSDDDAKTLLKLFRGVTRSEIKKIQLALELYLQHQPAVSIDKRSRTVRSGSDSIGELVESSKIENNNQEAPKETASKLNAKLSFRRKVRHVLLSEDSENIYRVRFDLAGKTVIINEDHELGPELHKFITAKEHHDNMQVIVRAILEEATNEEFIKSLPADGKANLLVRGLITRILSQII